MSLIRSGLSLALVLAACPGLQAQGARKIPDYSGTERAKIPEAFTCRATDIYPSHEAWRKELQAVKAELGGLGRLAQGWTASPKAMADLLEWHSGIQQRVQRLGAYASLLSDMDMSDSLLQSMKGEAQDLGVTLASQLTFLEPDVLAL